MRVRTSQSKLGLRFYIIKTYYDTKGIERTITVEKLGSEQEIREKTGRDRKRQTMRTYANFKKYERMLLTVIAKTSRCYHRKEHSL